MDKAAPRASSGLLSSMTAEAKRGQADGRHVQESSLVESSGMTRPRKGQASCQFKMFRGQTLFTSTPMTCIFINISICQPPKNTTFPAADKRTEKTTAMSIKRQIVKAAPEGGRPHENKTGVRLLVPMRVERQSKGPTTVGEARG